MKSLKTIGFSALLISSLVVFGSAANAQVRRMGDRVDVPTVSMVPTTHSGWVKGGVKKNVKVVVAPKRKCDVRNDWRRVRHEHRRDHRDHHFMRTMGGGKKVMGGGVVFHAE